MKKIFISHLSLFTFLLISLPPNLIHAELSTIEIGGKLEIYGATYLNWAEPSDLERIPQSSLIWRSIGPDGTYSAYRTGKGAEECSFFEQRARLHVKANFSHNIGFFLEFDNYDIWGEDFRSSDYILGVDIRSQTNDDIELFQSYIEIKELLDVNCLSFTIGRQTIDLGSGWLVGSDPPPDPFAGISFDGIRIKYGNDTYSLDAFYTKLLENFDSFNHGDINFAGIYLTFKNIAKLLNIDLYYLLLRDDRKLELTQGDFITELFEDLLDRDQVSTTYIHTLGLRFYGEYTNLDYDFEIAYQWTHGSHPGLIYVPVEGIYGDDDVQWNLPAGHFEVGYTFSQIKVQPRVFLGFCYYGGKDKRDLSFFDWLFDFGEGKASYSFNRLFSSYREDSFIDCSAMSNFWKIYTGTTWNISESFEFGFHVIHLQTVSPFDSPYNFEILDRRIYFIGPFSFITRENSKNLGWQTLLYANYSLTEDFSIELGWAHFFVNSGLAEGSFIDNNTSSFISTQSTDDADLFYFYSSVEF